MDNTKQNLPETIVRGAWSADIIRRPGCHSRKLLVRLNHPDGFHTSWPIRYDNGAIGYDWHDVPRDAQRAVKAAFRWIADNGE